MSLRPARLLPALLLPLLCDCATAPPTSMTPPPAAFDPTGWWHMGPIPAAARAVVTLRSGRASAPASIPAKADPDSVVREFPDWMNLEYQADPKQLSVFLSFDVYYDVPMGAMGDDKRGALDNVGWLARPLSDGCRRKTTYSLRPTFDDAQTLHLIVGERMEILPAGSLACAEYLKSARGRFGGPDGDSILAALDAAGLLPAAAEDLARIDLEYPIEGRRADPKVHSLESCGDSKTFFTLSPIVHPTDGAAVQRDLAAVGPLGNFAPSGHVYPTQHIYFYPPTEPGKQDQVVRIPVFAPADLTIFKAGSMIRFTDGTFKTPLYREYRLDWALCREVKGYFLQLEDLAPDLVKQFGLDTMNGDGDGAECRDSQNGNAYYRECNKPVDLVRIKAGTPLGFAGRAATKDTPAVFTLDFGLQDRRVPQILADPSLTPGWEGHAVCPLDYFTPDSPVNILRAKLGSVDGNGRLRAAPGCGGAYQDVPGTARGIWIDPDATIPNQDPNITLGIYALDDKMGAFSLGESVQSAGFKAPYGGQVRSIGRTAWIFPLRADPGGTVNTPFDRVKAGDPAVYCYEQLRDQYRLDDPAALEAVFYVQAGGDGTLRFAVDANHTSCPPAAMRALGPDALTFRR